jgi:hypothetical protein
MLKTLELLTNNPVVLSYSIQNFKQGIDFYYIKCSAIFLDESEIYITEYVSTKEWTYSYHWQDANGELIARWDNAPNHPEIATFPHHKHAPNVQESSIVGLNDVLNIIEKEINDSQSEKLKKNFDANEKGI